MRCAGTSSVVMASTSVDLPEPMSPVSKALRPPRSSDQTRLSKVPQLNTSRRINRKPHSALGALMSATNGSIAAASNERCASVITDLGAGELRLIGRQTRIKLRQPLGIDKRLQDASHFIAWHLPHTALWWFQATHKTQLNHFVQIGFNLIHQARLVRANWHKHPQHF